MLDVCGAFCHGVRRCRLVREVLAAVRGVLRELLLRMRQRVRRLRARGLLAVPCGLTGMPSVRLEYLLAVSQSAGGGRVPALWAARYNGGAPHRRWRLGR